MAGFWGHRPTASMVVAVVALVVALSGTAVAASSLVNGDTLIKKNSLSGNRLRSHTLSGNRLRSHTLTGKQIKLSKLGTVPSARHAVSAGHASTADLAMNATHAGDADQLGGVPVANYVTPGSVLQPGQTESGVFSATGDVTGDHMIYAIGFNPRLPAGIPASNAHYVTEFSTNSACPGVGQAAPGNLCVYENTTPMNSSFIAFLSVASHNSFVGVDPQGTVLEWQVTGQNEAEDWGTWSVTP